MICDTLENIEYYKGIHPNIDKAIEFLLASDLQVEEGRIVIDEENVFANVISYTPKVLEESRYEGHQKYADIQIMLEGSELLYNAPIKDVQCIECYDEVRDIAFYEGEAMQHCILTKGNFVLCLPTDAHMPGINYGIQSLKKMVVKVRLDKEEKYENTCD